MNIPNPSTLKSDLLVHHKTQINLIINLLEKYFDEKVNIHYTFEDYNPKTVWCFDLDFYLTKNETQLPISTAGNKKLPVCFVIMPPLYKQKNNQNLV